MPLDRLQDAPKSPSDAPRQTRRRTPYRPPMRRWNARVCSHFELVDISATTLASTSPSHPIDQQYHGLVKGLGGY